MHLQIKCEANHNMWYFRLVNSIKAGSAKKINQSTMAFKCMENINVFLEAARDLGVPPQETFQTVDLWERQNLNAVVICLQSLGRKVSNSTDFACVSWDNWAK
jgi:hypothetical protein